MTDHNRLFKELLHNFFDEFLEAFFQEVFHALDLSHKKFLSEELFPDLIDGDKKRADVITETQFKENSKNCVLIIHMEAQNTHQEHFPQRMFTYFSMIYLKFRKPVLPIAIFSYDGGRDEPNEFVIKTPFLDAMTFRFLKMELGKMNWRVFMHSNNPVSAALMSKMNYKKKERVAVRLAFLRQMAGLQLDEARSSMINGFFETYLNLNENEVDQLMKEVRELPKDEREQVIKWPNSFYDRGVKKGKAEGMAEGKTEGKIEAQKEMALRMLQKQMDLHTISELTGLSIKEIINLKK
ncbi:transposase [Sporolactobacillus sp. STSJ-5]|uniref:transposase n=1 Tax=Sporolactobacillus sp. STSJ-5 TaxID=2965076 RepID=UPI0021027DED|nr:transposase [Sporolactobacillus sp. STSJ-5]